MACENLDFEAFMPEASASSHTPLSSTIKNQKRKKKTSYMRSRQAGIEPEAGLEPATLRYSALRATRSTD